MLYLPQLCYTIPKIDIKSPIYVIVFPNFVIPIPKSVIVFPNFVIINLITY